VFSPRRDAVAVPRSTVKRVVIVPGLGVRSYALEPAERLRRNGHRVSLLRPPAWRGAPTDLEAYGRALAAELTRRDQQVDLLVGLSVGTQAAAAAALASPRVRRLLLISPTVDPGLRTLPRLLKAWWSGNQGHGEPGFLEQVPDWAHAGVPRLAAGFVRTLTAVPLEQVLPRVEAQVVVLHAEHDDLGTEAWARRLAEGADGRFLHRAGAPHSWPVGDPDGFAALVDELLDEGAAR
jgi:hypothetical protein